MKRILVVLASLALVASLTACAKAPTEEINATKAAVDAAVAEGAQQYTPEDYKMVSDGLAAAKPKSRSRKRNSSRTSTKPSSSWPKPKLTPKPSKARLSSARKS